jgi:hypothetical protein
MVTLHKSPVKVATDLQNDVQVLHSRLNELDGLTIDEEFDTGGDPYNSTGQHAIIKPKTDADE